MHDTTSCLNCGAAASNHFCSMCGQETRLHVPSAREFIHEFIGHYVALEGRLWRTLKLLVFKPGKLTTEYLAGRRGRYVIPLRLFLTFSILFFFTLKFAGHVMDSKRPPREATVAQQQADAAAIGKASAQAIQKQVRDELAAEGIKSGVTVADDAGPLAEGFRRKLDRFNKLPNDEKSRAMKAGFFSYVPYAMFLLMPVFALYLKLLYLGSGRRYGEHLLFALHTNAFAYFQLTLLLLAPDWGWLTFLLAAWLFLYLPTAMRRVYGGTRLATFGRWVVLGFLHFVSLVAAVVAVLAMSVGLLAGQGA